MVIGHDEFCLDLTLLCLLQRGQNIFHVPLDTNIREDKNFVCIVLHSLKFSVQLRISELPVIGTIEAWHIECGHAWISQISAAVVHV